MKFKLTILLPCIFALLSLTVKSHAQENYWTDIEHLNDSLRAQPKPMMVFIHTDWCKYCKMQEQTTFSDITLLKKLSDKYYCIKLNAESKKEIKLLSHYFSASSADYHQLALMIGTTSKHQTLTFPSTVFLEPSLNITYQHKGLLSKEQLSRVLKQH